MEHWAKRIRQWVKLFSRNLNQKSTSQKNIWVKCRLSTINCAKTAKQYFTTKQRCQKRASYLASKIFLIRFLTINKKNMRNCCQKWVKKWHKTLSLSKRNMQNTTNSSNKNIWFRKRISKSNRSNITCGEKQFSKQTKMTRQWLKGSQIVKDSRN